MKISLQLSVVFGLALLTGCLFVHARTSNQVNSRVTVAGMSIAKEDPKSEYGGSMVPGIQPGTTIHLLVELPGRNIIKIHENKEGQLTIEDSTGKSLTPSGSGIGFMSDISDDGQTIRLPIASADLPSRQANSIAINGYVNLTCGSDSKTDQYDVVIRKDAKMTIANIEFQVNEVKDSYLNENEEMFELQCHTSPAPIQKVEAVMKNGATIELRAAGSSRIGFGDSVTWGRSYSVAGKAADIMALKVTYFQHVEQIEVPLGVAIGLGF